ncbi:MAG TPA: hypothetical protein VMV25_03935 [Steroidobacteraceae bacterium]|nr:hypothetical protein [Steroidobacteraceae bacterium]
MQVISFKDTAMLKRGFWLSAVALIAYLAAPSVLNGNFWRRPLINLIPLCILSAFWAYFLWKTPVHRLAEQVMDCGDHLKVRKGRTEEVIPFAGILMAEVSTHLRMHRITVRLCKPTKFGDQIDFLPQASLWGNLAAIRHLALNLTARANRARGGPVGDR